MKYRITETAVYEVEAESRDQAEIIFLASEDPNKFFSHVERREVEEQ